MPNQGTRNYDDLPDGLSVLGMLSGTQATDEVMLALNAIRLDGGTQPRAEINWDLVVEYATEMRQGTVFPPVDVFKSKDGTCWLADGFHRYHAALNCSTGPDALPATIRAKIHQGTRRDAQLFSAGVNAAHGYRRTSADKRRAVMLLLNDPEWSQWANREIARRCKVDEGTVRNLRERASAEIPQIAKHATPTTTEPDEDEIITDPERLRQIEHNILTKPLPPAPQTRTVQRGGQVYQQTVSSDKRSQAAQARQPAPASRPPSPAPKPSAVPAPHYAEKPRVGVWRIRDEGDWLRFSEWMLEQLARDDGGGFEIEVRKA